MDTRSMTDSQLVGELDRFIGRTLTAFTASITDRTVINTIRAGQQKLLPHERTRLELAYDLLGDVAEAESEDTARAWFIGANTGDRPVSPAEAIRDGRYQEAERSARRMCDPEDMGS